MKFIVSKDYNHSSAMVSHLIEGLVKQKPDAWIALPAHSSFDRMYEHLVEAVNDQEVDLSKVHFVLVHEYLGLSQNHPESAYEYLNRKLFTPCHISLDNIHAMDGSQDAIHEASAFNQFMDAVGPLDMVISGIGLNGHIAYNQPSEGLYPRIHADMLDVNSRMRLSKAFDDVNEVPTQTLTLGIQDLLSAKKLVLLVAGIEKSSLIKKVLDTKTIQSTFPASFINLHPQCILCVDQEAALETGFKVLEESDKNE